MKLTAAAVKNAKTDAKPMKLFDGGGMYLFVKPNGSKYWRIDFRVNGKYKTLGLGIYPEVSLADARARREQTRQLITQGINTFEIVGREWLEKQLPRCI